MGTNIRLCLLFGVIWNVAAQSEIQFGMNMSDRAFQSVCWFESLKLFPHTNITLFDKCNNKALRIQMMVSSKGDGNAKDNYGLNMVSDAMSLLPGNYSSFCNQYLLDNTKEFGMNEGDAVNDGRYVSYPWRGFAYCMMNTLRKTHGDSAIESVKAEKTHRSKTFVETILDRDNEFRLRHGVTPFELENDLIEAAQKWAKQLAQDCEPRQSDVNDTGRQWKHTVTGESYFSSNGIFAQQDAAYYSSDAWYQENQFYPFPRGYKGNNEDELFEKISHFTQTVWAATKRVGYGIAVNMSCPRDTWFVVARYSPIGNMEGQYKANVLPSTDSLDYFLKYNLE